MPTSGRTWRCSPSTRPHGSAEFPTLSPARKRIIENDLRDFRLSGAELPEDQKPRFKEIQEELPRWAPSSPRTCSTPPMPMPSGSPTKPAWPACPTMRRRRAPPPRRTASRAGSSPCTRRPTCRCCSTATTASCARACTAPTPRAPPSSALPERDNGPLIERLLALRHEEAQCSATPTSPRSRWRQDGRHAGPGRGLPARHGEKGAPLRRARRGRTARIRPPELGLETLESWDLAWASEKLKQQRYSFSDDEVKQYFPEPKVLAGLFRVIESLFARQAAHPTTGAGWHPGRALLPHRARTAGD
jgi:oligopeptidase A